MLLVIGWAVLYMFMLWLGFWCIGVAINCLHLIFGSYGTVNTNYYLFKFAWYMMLATGLILSPLMKLYFK